MSKTTDRFRMIKGLASKFAALRSRGEPSGRAQLDLDGLDRHLRGK